MAAVPLQMKAAQVVRQQSSPWQLHSQSSFSGSLQALPRTAGASVLLAPAKELTSDLTTAPKAATCSACSFRIIPRAGIRGGPGSSVNVEAPTSPVAKSVARQLPQAPTSIAMTLEQLRTPIGSGYPQNLREGGVSVVVAAAPGTMPAASVRRIPSRQWIPTTACARLSSGVLPESRSSTRRESSPPAGEKSPPAVKRHVIASQTTSRLRGNLQAAVPVLKEHGRLSRELPPQRIVKRLPSPAPVLAEFEENPSEAPTRLPTPLRQMPQPQAPASQAASEETDDLNITIRNIDDLEPVPGLGSVAPPTRGDSPDTPRESAAAPPSAEQAREEPSGKPPQPREQAPPKVVSSPLPPSSPSALTAGANPRAPSPTQYAGRPLQRNGQATVPVRTAQSPFVAKPPGQIYAVPKAPVLAQSQPPSLVPKASPTETKNQSSEPQRTNDTKCYRLYPRDGKPYVCVESSDGRRWKFDEKFVDFELQCRDIASLTEWLGKIGDPQFPGLLMLLAGEVTERGAELDKAKKEYEGLRGSEDYQYFGLDSAECTDKDIDRAYRKLSTHLHPDKGGDSKGFLDMRERYDQLKAIRTEKEDRLKQGSGTIKWDPRSRPSMLQAHGDLREQLVWITKEHTEVSKLVADLKRRHQLRQTLEWSHV